MLTSISADTYKRLSPDAGVVVFNVDLSAAAKAADVIAALETAKEDLEKWVGVTVGGVKVNEQRKTWTPNFDYRRLPVVGDKFLDSADPKLTFSLAEFTPENVKRGSGAADITGTGKQVIQPRAHFEKGDYIAKMTYVTMVGDEGLYIVEADNVLCTKGLEQTSDDKKIGELAMEFLAHKTDMSKPDELPVRYYFVAA